MRFRAATKELKYQYCNIISLPGEISVFLVLAANGDNLIIVQLAKIQTTINSCYETRSSNLAGIKVI